MDNKYITVSALNKYLYYKFDNDLNLRSIYLKAEISNARISKGILYFVLKDKESEINALMFSNNLQSLSFVPKDGMTVLVNGKVSLYAKRGTYAITVVTMEESGIGDAYRKFEELKAKLAKEGLFDESKKLPIKRFNKRIGVITSGTGDAMHDIFSTIKKRFPLSEIIFYPAIVQGDDAPLSLIKALNKANSEAIVDVIIIARGGGTIEDLSCFNDEELARTIFSSSIPTISGVGHEADYTICDFVSSLRAPTPTGAAMFATPDQNELLIHLDNMLNKLVYLYKQQLINKFNKYNTIYNRYGIKNFKAKFDTYELKLNSIKKRIELLSPINKINSSINDLQLCFDNINKSFDGFINNKDNKINTCIDKLILLNPLNVMKKGYSITYKNNIVSTYNNLLKDDDVTIQFYDGIVDAKITNKR